MNTTGGHPVTVHFSGTTLDVRTGDIVSQKDIEVVVNAANARLAPGGGVAGAIHRAAGPGLEEESSRLAPIKPGDAVITGGYNLPNSYVVHCLGPVFGIDVPEAELLSLCYRNALSRAEDVEASSIAFPAISTGAFGYPVKKAAEVAMRTILDEIPGLKSVKLIRFVLYSQADLETHEVVLEELLSR
jgi:O-acetyl-ADP-ribose deacetylase